MDILEYSLPKSNFSKYEYVVNNSADLHVRFDKLFTEEDEYEKPVSDYVELKICKSIDEKYPVTLKEILPDINCENVVSKPRRYISVDSVLSQKKSSMHDHNRISIIFVSRSTIAKISHINCIKVAVASENDNEVEIIQCTNVIDKDRGDIVTRKERIANDVSNLLGVAALRPLKRKCEKLSYVLHGEETNSASSKVGSIVKSGVVMPERSTNSMSTDVDKATCEILLEEMLALYKIINIQDPEKPAIKERTNTDISKEVCQAMFAISPSIKRMGYRLSKFYIYAVEMDDDAARKKRNDAIEKILKEHEIYEYEIASCTENIKEFSFVGASIEARSDAQIVVSSTMSRPAIKSRGTLGCFVNLDHTNGQSVPTPGVVLSRHVAMHCDDLYDISNGSDKKIGRILEETCNHEHGSLDIAAAEMLASPENVNFKSSTEVYLPGKLHDYNGEDLLVCSGRKVHIWGATSRPGYGIITAPEVIYAGMNDPLIQIEDKDGMEGTRFAKEGDSGAIVCADDPENKCVHALAMVVGTPTPENKTGPLKTREYLTVPLSRGLAQIQRKTGKNVDLH